MTDLSWVQWPAMAVTVGATWLVASKQARRRCAGFWLFLLSNLLWIAWALPEGAWALLVLQLFLAAMNVHGARQQAKSESTEAS